MSSSNQIQIKRIRKQIQKYGKKVCSFNTVTNLFPILKWLPNYCTSSLILDIIAGITVGLTAIPQGIAYAVVAGLSPEYGLYSGLMGGFVYLIFGSCKDVTVGPTAIMSALVAKYVTGYSADFAVLAAFLSGLVILLVGVLQLGFLIEFISQPVINGFTTAAALQIAASQLKSLFGLTGQSGNYFAESVYFFAKNIKSAKLWDSVTGFSTILILIMLKLVGKGCTRNGSALSICRWFISLARNAVVVVLGVIVAYVIKYKTDTEPLVLTGDIGSGLPKIQLPPFSTIVNNETFAFEDMLTVLGPKLVVLPFVAILESVAIAKAFAGSKTVDATQEMIALGFCNIVGSFVSSMPVTGSFTRTALNNASGVQTTAGGIFTSLLIILALSLLTSTFYFIPKATLAGLIMTAMYSLIDLSVFGRLWKNSKKELLIFLVTIAVCLFAGLEYGIISGIILDAALLLYITARPRLQTRLTRDGLNKCKVLILPNTLSYCSADYIRREVLETIDKDNEISTLIIDGENLIKLDTTVASNLMSVAEELLKIYKKVFFVNFRPEVKGLCVSLRPKCEDIFVIRSDVLSEHRKSSLLPI